MIYKKITKKEIKDILLNNGYKVIGFRLPDSKRFFAVGVLLNNGIERFNMPNELREYLHSFAIYEEKITLYINKEIWK